MDTQQEKCSGLVVLEYPYLYAAWHVDKQNPEMIISERKSFSPDRRALEDYHLCGVYSKAGLPYEIVTIDGSPYPDLEPYQAIPLHFAAECQKAVLENKKILISSGYCAFAPAIAGGLEQALGKNKKVGVIWVDAHCDNIIVEETQRDDLRFVGFPLSAIAGQTMEVWRKEYCKLERPCLGEQVLVSDGRRTGPEGLANLQRAGIPRVTEEQFENSAYWKEQVEKLAEKVDAIFLMVDADIMTSACVPAYFRQEPGGHDVTKVMENVRIVMETGKVAAFACFCVDFDKYAEGGDITYLNGMRVIGAGLEAWGDK